MILSGSKIHTILAVIAAIGLLGLSNCKPPDEPLTITEEPVFALKGTIDGVPLQMIAGVNGYYMFTEYNRLPQDSIYRFSGRLSKDGCTNCEAIEVIIGDADKSTGIALANMNKALGTTIKLEDPSQIASKQYSVRLIAEDSGFISPTYLWTFGNTQDTSTVANPVVTFTNSFSKNICLTISDAGCSNTICNMLFPFEVDKGDSIPLGFGYIISNVVGNVVDFNNTSVGVSYEWDFGDGSVSSAHSPRHQYASPGTYRVCLRVRTANRTHIYCKNVVVNDPTFRCLANMTYGTPSVTITHESFISKAIIRYTAKNGDVYESNQNAQPSTSFFTIASHKSYLPNEKGEKTQQVTIRFRCRVFNTRGNDFKDLEITNGVIAVAHP